MCCDQKSSTYDNKYNERLNEINQLLKNNDNDNDKEKKENNIILSSDSIKELEELILGRNQQLII